MRPLVIGIGGGTASGKSTVAAAFAHRMHGRALLLLHDRYYHPVPIGVGALDWNFDHPDSLDTPRLVRDLDALREGRAITVPRYEYNLHARALAEDLIEPRPILVVEGILVLENTDLCARFDHKVYVDCPDDIRLARRIRRDIQKRGRTALEVLDQWEKTVRPMHEAYVVPSRVRADQILDGTAPVESLVDAILAIPKVAATTR